MSWFDLGALLLVLAAVFDGARSGLLWAVLELGLLIASGLTARGLRPHVEPYVSKFAELSAEDLHAASFVVVFVAVACVLAGLLVLVHPASKRWRFRHDAWYGGVLGAVNGALAAVLLFSMAIWSTPRPTIEDQAAGSALVPVLGAAYEHGLERVLPEHVPERVSQLGRP
jgi:hypothetical protein